MAFKFKSAGGSKPKPAFRPPHTLSGGSGGGGGGGGAGERGAPGPAGAPGAGAEGANVLSYGAVGDGVADDTAAFNAATAAVGKSSVYVPPGTYNLGAATLTRDVKFASGAVLKPTAGQTVLFNGAGQRIEGLNVLLAAASSSTWNAVEVRGANSTVDGVSISVTDDIPNCTLLKVTGERAALRRVRLTSAGKAFKYGLHAVATGGGVVEFVTVDGIDADVGDDGASVSFGALVYARSRRSIYRHVQCVGGGRASFPNGIVVVDGFFNTFEDPFISGPLAAAAFYLQDSAEFCFIRGGWLAGNPGGTILSASEGIHIGHNCDHFSAKDVTITGWDYGVGFHGSNNIPQLDGVDTSINGTAGILIDSKVSAVDYPVSGLRMIGCYAEFTDEGPQPIYIWAKSGYVIGGCMLSAGSIGYTAYLIQIDSGFAGFTGFYINGNRIVAKDGTGGGILANANTDILFGDANDISVSNTVASGASAAKVRQARDPLLNGVTVGSSGTHVTKYFSVVVSMNFTHLEVGEYLDVVATVAGVAIGDTVVATPDDALVYPGDVYWARATGANQVTVRRVAGSAFTPGAGNVRISYWKH